MQGNRIFSAISTNSRIVRNGRLPHRLPIILSEDRLSEAIRRINAKIEEKEI